MIERIWRGWTAPAQADAYEALLKNEVLPGIAAMQIPGYRGVRVLRRELEAGEVEFSTVMSFDSVDSVRAFVGEDYEVAHVPTAAQALLTRYDARSKHYDVRWELRY